jgi:hypothetical protein
MNNFNLHKTIINLCLTADAIDDYSNKLVTRREELEGKLVDLYHIVELYDLSDAQIKKLYREMKKVLRDRRKVKNDIYICDIFARHKSKLPSEITRKFLLQAVGTAAKRQDNASYHCRIYTHNDINKILGAKILPVEQGGDYGEEEIIEGENQNM